MNDDRRTHGERFEYHVTKRFGEERRHHHRVGVAKQAGQRVSAQQPLESHVRQVRCHRPQGRLVGSGSSDAQIHLGKVAHHGNQALKALHFDQPPRGGEVWAVALRAWFGCDSTRPSVGQEIGDLDQAYMLTDAAAAVYFQGVAAGENQGVKVAQPAFNRRESRQSCGGRPPCTQQLTQLGPAQGSRSYFQSRCIGQISQCSCAVIILTARRFVPRPRIPGPPTSEIL